MLVTRPLSFTTAHVWHGSSAVHGAESALAEFKGNKERDISAMAVMAIFAFPDIAPATEPALSAVFLLKSSLYSLASHYGVMFRRER